MKKFLFALAVITVVLSCTKKATPAKSETTAPSAPVTETKETSATTASAEIVAAGKLTYDAKCGKCHALHAANEYTAEKWGPLVDAMAPKARLTDAEKANVLAYVKANAKQ